MTTTRNKIKISEIIHMAEEIQIRAHAQSEFITIMQDSDYICIRTDQIPTLISSLERFYKNGEITED